MFTLPLTDMSSFISRKAGPFVTAPSPSVLRRFKSESIATAPFHRIISRSHRLTHTAPDASARLPFKSTVEEPPASSEKTGSGMAYGTLPASYPSGHHFQLSAFHQSEPDEPVHTGFP